ncbi:MAG: zinc ribbon-containing protein [Gammaproteobacteria bacterium]|nr:zinc ribbon-containing protein [Gammaproteobacteria bacterium]
MIDKDKTKEKLVEAYDTMLSQLKDVWHDAEEKALPTLKEGLEVAKQKASELGELTKEEADKVSDYVKRDLQEAGEFLSENGKQLKDWIKFDLEYAEVRLAEMFAGLADNTRIELEKIAERARKVGEWHTGEITTIGILRCIECGELLHFEKTGHIPPCPKCHGTVFKKDFGKG